MTPRVRRRSLTRNARDGGARPEVAPARPVGRTCARGRRTTATATRCGSEGGPAREDCARPGQRVGAAPHADTHATVAPDPEHATARTLRRIRARRRRRRPKSTACWRVPSGGHARDSGSRVRGRADMATQVNTRATAAPDLEGTPASPVWRTCARRRRPIPRARQCGPSGGHAGDCGARPRGRAIAALRRLRPTPIARQRGPEGRAIAAPRVHTRATAARPLRWIRARPQRPTRGRVDAAP